METELHEEVSMSLADSLRVLLEHGLMNCGEGAGLTGNEGCVSVWGRWGRRRVVEEECAAWRVFQFYYSLKVGICWKHWPYIYMYMYNVM